MSPIFGRRRGDRTRPTSTSTPSRIVSRLSRRRRSIGLERLEPRQVMAGTTIGDSLPGMSSLVPPSGAADYTVVTSVWGMGKNAPKLFENDDFTVKVSFVKAAGPVYPRPVTVGVWADINFNKQPDPGEEYNATTVVPQGFIQARFKAIDDGPWPGNGTPLDTIPIVVTVSDGGAIRQVHAGATVYNVAPMFAKLPEYTPGVDSSGRWYIDVTATFWDPGNQDRFDLRLQSKGRYATNLTSGRMAPQPLADDVLKRIQHRFYMPGRQSLGDSLGDVVTLTISDDDSGKDARWNQWQTVGLNDDDDNRNGIVDLRDRGLVNGDPDVVKLGGLRAVQPGWLLPHMRRADGELVLFYDPKVVRVWDSPQKNLLFAPYEGLPEIGHRFTGRETLYVEGVGHGSTDIYATWTPNKPGFFVNEKMNQMVSHSFTISVFDTIDVDIDSDNDSNVQADFERDAWNEYLEDSPYALGKFVGSHFESSLVPFVITVPDLSPMAYATQRISFSATQTSTLGGFQIRQHNQPDSRRLDLGTIIYPLELGIVKGGDYVFWVQLDNPVPELKYANNDDFTGAIQVAFLGSQDAVKVRGILHNNSAPIGIKDAYGEFVMALQNDPAVRSAGAAQAVYADRSDPRFAIKQLDKAEVERLLRMDSFFSSGSLAAADPGLGSTRQELLQYVVDSLTTDVPPGSPGAGFRARMYLDHCDTVETKSPKDGGGRYVIAFQGTNFDSLSDWFSNLTQFWKGESGQHIVALKVGWGLQSVTSFRWDYAGHSLGGGLAAAAALNSGKTANTFNAAGLNPALFLQEGSRSLCQPYARLGWANYEAGGHHLITAYVIEDTPPDSDGWSDCPDVLTWIQRTLKRVTGVGFEADGRHVEMEGLFNLGSADRYMLEMCERRLRDIWEAWNTGTTSLDPLDVATWNNIFLDLFTVPGLIITDLRDRLVKSHGFPSLLYGLLHDDSSAWNAYDWGGER